MTFNNRSNHGSHRLTTNKGQVTLAPGSPLMTVTTRAVCFYRNHLPFDLGLGNNRRKTESTEAAFCEAVQAQ